MLWTGESLPTWLPGTERQGAVGAHFRFNLRYSPTLEGLRLGYLSPDVEKPVPLGVKKCVCNLHPLFSSLIVPTLAS